MKQKKCTKPSKNKPTLSKETQEKMRFMWWIFIEVIPEIYSQLLDAFKQWA